MTGDYSSSPNPHKLYRDKRNGVLAGVCAGLADYFNVDVALLRILTIVSLVFLTPPTVIGYLIAAVVIPERPRERPPLSAEEEGFWRGVSQRPEATFSNLKYQFRDLDERLQAMEHVVTSEEWRLRREFRKIEDPSS